MRKRLKRIKESVTEPEYKKLMNAVRGDESIRENTRSNLLRAFTILYFTGLRLNELQQMKLQHIKDLMEQGSCKLILSKTNSERKLFAGEEFQKQLKKLFMVNESTDLQSHVITKGSSKSLRVGINHDVFIKQVNRLLAKLNFSHLKNHGQN